MPGYLSHLAARLSGAKPALHPRIPSIFESVPGAALAVAPDRGGLRVVEQEQIVSQPPAFVPAMARVEAEPSLTPRADSLSATPEPRPARSISRRADSFEEIEATDIPAAPPRPRSERRAEPPLASDIPLPLTERVLAGTELRSTSLEESHSATRQSEQHTPHFEPELPRSSRAELLEPRAVRVDREEPRVERRLPETERAPVVAPPLTPQALPFAPQPEVRPVERFPALAEAAAHQPASVQVTIGKLIVEAVSSAPAAAPQPAPRPHAPRLSLDDYLRQRRSQA